MGKFVTNFPFFFDIQQIIMSQFPCLFPPFFAEWSAVCENLKNYELLFDDGWKFVLDENRDWNLKELLIENLRKFELKF